VGQEYPRSRTFIFRNPGAPADAIHLPICRADTGIHHRTAMASRHEDGRQSQTDGLAVVRARLKNTVVASSAQKWSRLLSLPVEAVADIASAVPNARAPKVRTMFNLSSNALRWQGARGRSLRRKRLEGRVGQRRAARSHARPAISAALPPRPA
jgi:hypothetical protein